MAAQTWTSLQTTLLATLVKAQPPYNVVPPDFAALFPQATSYAEGRIFHDIPMLGTRQSNTSLLTSIASRTVDTSAMINPNGGPIIIPEQFALITPAGAMPAQGTRVSFDRASPELIDQIWPVENLTVTPTLASFVPRYWAYRDNQAMTGFAPVLIFAPTADASYVVELTGLFQPTPISADNPITYLSTVYPDLLEAGCMVFLSGALTHNFGAQADDPKMALSWEGIYQGLLETIRGEEARRRGLVPDKPQPPGAPAR